MGNITPILDKVQNDHLIQNSPIEIISTESLPDHTQNHLMISAAKRDERKLSIQETLVKQEKDRHQFSIAISRSSS